MGNGLSNADGGLEGRRQLRFISAAGDNKFYQPKSDCLECFYRFNPGLKPGLFYAENE